MEIQQKTQHEINPSDYPEVIVCVGPPYCELQDERAVENQIAGCPLCRRIVCLPDGSTAEYHLKTN